MGRHGTSPMRTMRCMGEAYPGTLLDPGVPCECNCHAEEKITDNVL